MSVGTSIVSLMENGTYLQTENGLVPIQAKSGYWVAFQETTLDEATPGDTIGVWTDSETGKVWVDNSIHLNDLTTALTFGKMFSQKAIFDIANKKEVRIE